MTQVEQRQYELVEAESSEKQLHEALFHQERMNMIVESEEYNLFALLKPTLTKEENQWRCFLNDDLVGFGNTPYLAILDWNKQFNKE